MKVHLEFPVPYGKRQFAQYMQLSEIAVRMQQSGWRVDMKKVASHHKDAQLRQERLSTIFTRLAGTTDIGKDGQTQSVKDYFWKTLGVPVVSVDRKTKRPKLDAAALLVYATEFEDERIVQSAAALYGYRKAGKTIGFCEEYAKSGGRVHASFNVTGTKGSRWSCSGPNIQQLPARGLKFDFGDGPEPIAVSLKDILIPDEGYVLVDADWAALELYLQTYIAGAKQLMTCIQTGRDLHLYNAQVMFGPKMVPDNATKKTHGNLRTVAKQAFGFAYNASDNVTQVWKQMKQKIPEMTEAMCKKLRERYFEHHVEFPRWQQRTKRSIDQLGYIDTPLMGRRLYLPSSMRGYNQALNSQCQITGGDLANRAIIALDTELRADAGEHIRAQVHDSFVVQCRPQNVERVAASLVRAMTAPTDIYGHTATFVAEPGVGENWGNMKEL